MWTRSETNWVLAMFIIGPMVTAWIITIIMLSMHWLVAIFWSYLMFQFTLILMQWVAKGRDYQ